jgi:hypothetical protein
LPFPPSLSCPFHPNPRSLAIPPTFLDLTVLFVAPGLLLYLLNFSWISPALTAWFGHLLFTQFQLRVLYLLLGVFVLLWMGYLSTFYYTSQEVYDFTIVLYSFFVWMVFLFYSNNLFTVIFFIEVLSTAISLTIITSVFSSTYFYNNLDLSNHSYFQHSTPFSFLQTLIFFFWISLISSLGLFVFLSLLYLNLLTFDWYTLEYTFYYYTLLGTASTFVTLSLVWLSFLFCLFLKCGLVPFFFWKPIFFKGIPLQALFLCPQARYFFLFLYFSLFFFFFSIIIMINLFSILIIKIIITRYDEFFLNFFQTLFIFILFLIIIRGR